MKLREHDIICALATPPGTSAIAVVRVSGAGSWKLVCSLAPEIKEGNIVSHKAIVSRLVDSERAIFDQALFLFFSEGKSYTGQESVEIHCHGNIKIVDHLIVNLCSKGARVAEPGEFTFRAFMNAKLDLVQAEGVLRLIHSDSISQAKQSLRVLGGEYSKRLHSIESGIVGLLAQIEAGIDFSTEGIELRSDAMLIAECQKILDEIRWILEQSSKGKIVKHGFSVALIGEPNAGKSSLLNSLLGENKALVTEIAGTTRDLVEGSIIVDGVRFQLFDTAGLRESHDRVECLGVVKAIDIGLKADLILWVINPHDGTQFNQVLLNSLNDFKSSLIQPVYTHKDLGDKDLELPNLDTLLDPIWISNLDIQNTQDQIVSLFRSLFSTAELIDSSLLIHTKQQDLLHKAKESLTKAIEELSLRLGHEVVALSLRMGLRSVHQVLGKDYDDQILDRVFSEFCIGK